MHRSPEDWPRLIALAFRLELVRGLLAVVILIVLIVSHVSMVWSLVLALLAYGGARLLAHGAASAPAIPLSRAHARTGRDIWMLCQARWQTIEALVTATKDADNAPRLDRITGRMNEIMAAIDEDEQYQAAPTTLDLMETTISLLTPYAKAQRRGLIDQVVQTQLNRDLGVLERALDLLWEKVNQETIANFSAISEMIQFNLEGVNATRQNGDRQ